MNGGMGGMGGDGGMMNMQANCKFLNWSNVAFLKTILNNHVYIWFIYRVNYRISAPKCPRSNKCPLS